MSKSKPKPRNRQKTGQQNESTMPTGPRQPDTLLGLPKNRIPHLIIFLVITIGGCYLWIWISNSMGIQQFGYEEIARYPHDPEAFTQGLLYEDGDLYESTGKYGLSELRRVEMKSGKLKKAHKLDDKFFGEGLTLMNDKFYQLTWKENVCKVYDREFNEIKQFEYEGEGWGLTHDGKHLIMSNGSSTLKFLNPETFEVVRKITVRYGRSPRHGLNELEYTNNKILANDINRPSIYEINPNTGEIEAEIDLKELVPKDVKVDVLNGIAFNTSTGHLLVTGKYWPHIYEINRVPASEMNKRKKK